MRRLKAPERERSNALAGVELPLAGAALVQGRQCRAHVDIQLKVYNLVIVSYRR